MTTDTAVAVGVDVGGTKLAAVSVDGDGVVIDRDRVTTPVGDAPALIDTIAGLHERLGPTLPLGVGIAGIVGIDGVLRYSPNLGVVEIPVARELANRRGVAPVVVNDATAAVVGEVAAGAARGCRDVVLLTLGTGVGGGLVVAGNVVMGANGYAAELGHIVVAEGGRDCPCGNRGCLEAYASGRAMAALAHARLEHDDAPSALRDADPLDGRAVSAAAAVGDEVARDVLREAGTWLGVGLASLVNALDPQRIVIGGGAAASAAPHLLPAADHAMRARLMGRDHREPPPIVVADLGDDAGVVGAALLALRPDGVVSG